MYFPEVTLNNIETSGRKQHLMLVIYGGRGQKKYMILKAIRLCHK